jgi:23S rRNA (uracil1939-C5)-methyltransferase
VEKLVYGGEGLARVEGRVALLPLVLPGERVRARVEREKPELVRATVVEVLEPAPARVPPPCPYFGRCGGCHYQHATYEFQLEAKRGILADQLRRIGRIEPPAEIEVVAADPWGYRNRAQFHIEGAHLGYQEARSHRLCAIDRCPISSPRINQAIGELAAMLRDPRWPRFVRSVEVFTDEIGVQVNVLESDRPVARRFFDWCAERMGGMAPDALDYQGRFRVGRHSFFQVNRFLADRLVETALGETRGGSALDLYAGVGLFSLPLAARFAEVTAVESVAAAAADLRFNAERALAGNLRVERRTAEAYLAALTQAPDFVLLDPPRTGMGAPVARRLGELRPREIAIVACDPATLARDLAGLLAAGYRIDRMAMVDLFPQTFHLETVVRLVHTTAS